jgi:hypothetical protein
VEVKETSKCFFAVLWRLNGDRERGSPFKEYLERLRTRDLLVPSYVSLYIYSYVVSNNPTVSEGENIQSVKNNRLWDRDVFYILIKLDMSDLSVKLQLTCGERSFDELRLQFWMFTTGPNSGTCMECVKGKYKSVAGSSDCISCPSNSNSSSGSAALTICTCKAGWTGPDGSTCTACSAGQFKSVAGLGSCEDSPASSDSPIGSTVKTSCTYKAGWSGPTGGPCFSSSAGAAAVHVVKMVMSLPMTKQEFETIISRRGSDRHLLTDPLRVDTIEKASDESMAVSMASAVIHYKINSELQKAGLPKVTMLETPKASTVQPLKLQPVQDNQQKTSSNSTTIAAVVSTVVVVTVWLAGALFWRRRALTKLQGSKPYTLSSAAAAATAAAANDSEQSDSTYTNDVMDICEQHRLRHTCQLFRAGLFGLADSLSREDPPSEPMVGRQQTRRKGESDDIVQDRIDVDSVFIDMRPSPSRFTQLDTKGLRFLRSSLNAGPRILKHF